MRVTERMFSTMVIRESASSLMSLSRETFFSEYISSLSSSTAAAPDMAVSGVRRSWDTARRMLLRMFSWAAFSCMAAFSSYRRWFIWYSALAFCSRLTASTAISFTREVRAHTIMEMATMLNMATG